MEMPKQTLTPLQDRVRNKAKANEKGSPIEEGVLRERTKGD